MEFGLRQKKYIRGHLRHRYSVTVNQVILTTVQGDDLKTQNNNVNHETLILYCSMLYLLRSGNCDFSNN